MHKFLIFQLARFGDLIQTKRLVQSLFLRGEVHICVDMSLKMVATLLYPKAHIHSVPAHNTAEMRDYSEQCKAVHACLSALQEHDFTAVYTLNHTPLNYVLARFFAPEIVQGYAMPQGQIVPSDWIKKAFTWTKQRQTNPINLVDFWAYFDTVPCKPAQVNPKAEIKGRVESIGIVLAGRESRRSLPPQVLAPVVKTIFDTCQGPQIFLLGAASEVPLARQLKRHLPTYITQKTTDLSGKTSWKELFEVVQSLHMLISPDTGTMHLGAHFGIPVQAFFLSSAFCYETGPYGEGHRVWQSVYECAPCLESAPCHMQTKCLEDYSHKDFLRALAVSTLQSLENKPLTLGNNLQLPQNLTRQDSCFDRLGATWQVSLGKDVYAAARLAHRTVVAEYCGVPLPQVPVDTQSAQSFYTDADASLHFRTPFLPALCAKAQEENI